MYLDNTTETEEKMTTDWLSSGSPDCSSRFTLKRSFFEEECPEVLWQKKLGLEPNASSLFFSGQKTVNVAGKTCEMRENIDFSGLIFHPCDLAEKQ